MVIKVVSDIVPKKASAKTLWNQLRGAINNKRHVQNQLNDFVEHYFYNRGNLDVKNITDR